MNREMILRKRLEMAQHNLYCYSAGWSMDRPKDGCEEDYKEAFEEVQILKAWLKEFHRSYSGSTVEYVGRLSTVTHGRRTDGSNIADQIEFEVDTGAGFMYGDRRILNLCSEVQDWFIGENGLCCGRYDIEKEQRDSTKLRITVDTINVVRCIEWAEAEEN